MNAKGEFYLKILKTYFNKVLSCPFLFFFQNDSFLILHLHYKLGNKHFWKIFIENVLSIKELQKINIFYFKILLEIES